jgi:hypothetical protein
MSAAPNNQDSIDRALEQLKEHVHPPTVRDLNNDGVRIIRVIFREFEGMGDIDKRLVIHPEGFQTYNGLAYLLGQMGLSMGTDDQKKRKMYGMLTNYLDSPSKACDGFGVWLKARADNIFTWIEVLQPVLHNKTRNDGL